MTTSEQEYKLRFLEQEAENRRAMAWAAEQSELDIDEMMEFYERKNNEI